MHNVLDLKQLLLNELSKPKLKHKPAVGKTFRIVRNWKKGSVALSQIFQQTSAPFDSRVRALINYALDFDTSGHFHRYIIPIDKFVPFMYISELRKLNPTRFFTDDIEFLRANTRYLNATTCALISLLEGASVEFDTKKYREIQRELKLQLTDKTIHYTRVNKAIELIELLNSLIKEHETVKFFV